MAAQSTVHQPPAATSATGVSKIGSAVADLPTWTIWLAGFFAINALVSSILLFGRASGTSSALNDLPLDDSWIHLVYIRAIATEGCLCYNTGIWEAGATSWAWVLLNAPFYLVGTEWLGIDPVFVIKFVGLLTAAVGSLFAFLLVRRITGSRTFGLVVVGIMALEPTFAFSRISGMEAPIVLTAALGSTLALVNRRYALAGLALAIAFLSRPEMGLFVAAALIVVGLAMTYRNRRTLLLVGRLLIEVAASDEPRVDWQRAKKGLKRATRSRALLWLTIPPVVSVAVWMAYNHSINGEIYPNTYLVKTDRTLALIPLANISNVFHWGVSYWQPWLSGWLLPISAAVYLVGGYFAVRKGGINNLALLLFPLLLIVAVGKSQLYLEVPFPFWTRRYVDAAAPITVMVLLVGGLSALVYARGYVASRYSAPGKRLLAVSPLYALLGVVAVFSINEGVGVWQKLYEDYSWNARNIADIDVASGIWINENTPLDATVMVADAGAIRYFGNRFTLDGIGLNSHGLIGRPQSDILITERPYAAATYATPGIEALPVATRHELFTTVFGSERSGGPVAQGPVGVYTFDWQRDDFASPDELHLIELEGEIVDTLNLTDLESEQAHEYFISFVNYAPNEILRIGDVIVEERGLTIGGHGEVTERFRLNAISGQPLTLVLRHISNEQPDFVQPDVFVGGVLAGQIPVEPRNASAQETAFTVPAELVTSDSVEIEVRWNIHITEFRWWAIVGSE